MKQSAEDSLTISSQKLVSIMFLQKQFLTMMKSFQWKALNQKLPLKKKFHTLERVMQFLTLLQKNFVTDRMQRKLLLHCLPQLTEAS